MVDRRVPGLVRVTDAQVEAAQLIVARSEAKGKSAPAAVKKIAGATIAHPGTTFTERSSATSASKTVRDAARSAVSGRFVGKAAQERRRVK